MATKQITADDLLDVLRKAYEQTPDNERPPGSIRMKEILEALSIKEGAGLTLIRGLKDQGLIEVVDIRHQDLADRVITVKGYRLIEADDDENPDK